MKKKIKQLSQETSQVQNHMARSKVLQTEMDAKMKEIAGLIQRIEQLDKDKQEALRCQSELQVDFSQVQRCE